VSRAGVSSDRTEPDPKRYAALEPSCRRATRSASSSISCRSSFAAS
jgi:hypothetical protein